MSMIIEEMTFIFLTEVMFYIIIIPIPTPMRRSFKKKEKSHVPFAHPFVFADRW